VSATEEYNRKQDEIDSLRAACVLAWEDADRLAAWVGGGIPLGDFLVSDGALNRERVMDFDRETSSVLAAHEFAVTARHASIKSDPALLPAGGVEWCSVHEGLVMEGADNERCDMSGGAEDLPCELHEMFFSEAIVRVVE
jgi:hypothetical protein